VSVVPGVAGSIIVCSTGDARHCIGSSSLDFSNAGHSTAGSSSDDSAICSLSKGRLSPSNLCMSGHAIPR
jgi:hypothetical protein